MIKLKVTFSTISPLWTGDAWGDNKEIRPSSLMGSLRFWFEVICYFAGITKDSNYKDGKLGDNVDEEQFKKKISNIGNGFNGVDSALNELGISLPSRIFGCTGWKGWVRIKEINFDGNNFNNSPSGRIIDRKNWFWGTPSYQGNFDVVFEVEKNITEPIFYPLLAFMEKYGFWGGKLNIGYGRLKIEKVEEKERDGWKEKGDWRKEEFGLSRFYKDATMKFNDVKFLDFIKSKKNFNELEQEKKEIMYLKNQSTNIDVKEIIKELIKIKSQHRHDISNANQRHSIFGQTGRNAQGTKIIPWIYEENGKLKGGFISIAGLLNLGKHNG